MPTIPSRASSRLAPVIGVAVLTSLVACSSGSGSGGSGSTTPTSGAAPASGDVTQIEVNPPGDIPDNQAFVPVQGTHFTVSVPEGWARLTNGGAVVYSDKYNSVTMIETSATTAPTPASVSASELPAVRRQSQQFTAGRVRTARRTSGTAVLAKYTALSAVNDVTGKAARLDVERYDFWRAGREVAITLAAPVGSDNVDPWRTITNSFRWAP